MVGCYTIMAMDPVVSKVHGAPSEASDTHDSKAEEVVVLSIEEQGFEEALPEREGGSRRRPISRS